MNENMELLIKAANNYYNGRELLMDDKSYDQLLIRTKESTPSFNIFDYIIIDEDDRTSMPHPLPYVAQECKIPFETIEEFMGFIAILKGYLLTYKFDGTSITAYYNNGKLYNILTRSDEVEGKKKLDQLRNKVKQLVNPDVLKIDYECTCSQEDFPEDTRSHSNGLINSCYKQDEVDKYITAIPFKVTTKSKLGYYESFILAGFSDEDIPLVKNIPTFDQRYVEYKGKHYPIDGFVAYNFEDNTISHKIWKHYGNQEVQTEVIDIEWNESEFLSWIPKVILDPIYLDGRSISRTASGGISALRNKSCGVGSKVYVYLANSTIPQISKVVKASTDFRFIEKCPYCGGKVDEIQNKLRCINPECTHSFNFIIKWWLSFVINDEEFESLHQEELDNIKDIDSLKSFLTKYNIKFSIEDTDKISYAMPIERFKNHEEAIEVLRDNLDKIKSEKSIKNIDMYMYTENQYEIFELYIPIVDKIIERILL